MDATALQLPYNNSNVKMLFILPNSKTGLSALESKLNHININQISRMMTESDIRISIPKFKIEFDVDLNEPMKKVTENSRSFIPI